MKNRSITYVLKLRVNVEDQYSYSCAFICRRFSRLRFVHVICALRNLGLRPTRRVPGVSTRVGCTNRAVSCRTRHFRIGADVNHCHSRLTKSSEIGYLDRRDPRRDSLVSNTNNNDPASGVSRLQAQPVDSLNNCFGTTFCCDRGRPSFRRRFFFGPFCDRYGGVNLDHRLSHGVLSWRC